MRGAMLPTSKYLQGMLLSKHHFSASSDETCIVVVVVGGGGGGGGEGVEGDTVAERMTGPSGRSCTWANHSKAGGGSGGGGGDKAETRALPHLALQIGLVAHHAKRKRLGEADGPLQQELGTGESEGEGSIAAAA
jgi:hypothetical protein